MLPLTNYHACLKRAVIYLISTILFITAIVAQPTVSDFKTSKSLMDEFMSKRFGMFIHFGPVTLRGAEIGWSRNKLVPQSEYDSLYKEFNPSLFNAYAWVRAAKAAGMKYMVITSRHHDGFCLWNTRYSGYNIMNSPFGRDIVGELAKACRQQSIAFCIYYSLLDWHDPDYPVQDPYDTGKNVPGNMNRFVGRIKNELREMITRYKPYLLWFDGNWEKPWTEEYGKEIYRFIKSVDKNIIINNRLGKGEHTAFSEASVGDYLTPEQKIGELNMKEPWESCITICRQWSWLPNDSMKSLKECIQTLVKTASGNGNLLLNVSPMLDGRMEARQINRLEEIGDWLAKYSTSIYGTKGGPYKPNSIYATTRKGNRIFLHIFNNANLKLTLPKLEGVKILKAYFLNGKDIAYLQGEEDIEIKLPRMLPDPISSVIVLELDKNAEQLLLTAN